MQGKKTHEQQLRILEGQPDMPDPRRPEPTPSGIREPNVDLGDVAQPVSRGGLHQESRDHNKHNDPGQGGHKPQRHGPAEEKH